MAGSPALEELLPSHPAVSVHALLMHSLTRSFAHSLIRSLIYSLILSLVHSRVDCWLPSMYHTLCWPL